MRRNPVPKNHNPENFGGQNLFTSPYFMRYWLESLLAKILSAFLTLLPFSVCDGIARKAGDLGFFLLRKRRAIAISNLDKAFGTSLPPERKNQIARAAFQNIAVSMTELFLIQKIEKDARSRFELEGREILDRAFERGKGVALVISHLGSWEYLSFLPYLTKHPWSVVVKALKNPHLNSMIDRLRRVTTVNPIYKVGSIRKVMQEIRANHGVAILIDQWAGGDGIWVDFFAHPSSTTSIPARLAKKTGCALVPAHCLRTAPGKYRIQILPEFAFDSQSQNWEHETTLKLNQELEKRILKHPEEWLWGHKRWKPKPVFSRDI